MYVFYPIAQSSNNATVCVLQRMLVGFTCPLDNVCTLIRVYGNDTFSLRKLFNSYPCTRYVMTIGDLSDELVSHLILYCYQQWKHNSLYLDGSVRAICPTYEISHASQCQGIHNLCRWICLVLLRYDQCKSNN